MQKPMFSPEQMKDYAAQMDLTNTTPEEIARMAAIAERVARVSAAIPRMPSKAHEPASVFKVPL